MASVIETLKEWDISDGAITRHGFTEYNRDYMVQVVFIGADRVEHPVDFLFRGCVEAHYESRLLPTTYPAFMDDRFIDYRRWQEAGYPDGFVWGVNFADTPSWEYIETSERAALWSQKLGFPMHEIEIDTNTYLLSLVFHDIVVHPTGESR